MSVGSVSNPYADLGLNLPKQESGSGGKDLGQEEFLKLMTTQLQNQDPFKPMENGDFIAQMAQFGTVSGIGELKQSVQDLAASMQADSVSKATSLVGRNVLVANDIGTLRAEGEEGAMKMRGAVELPQSVSDLTVSVYRLNGEQVGRIDLGQRPGGLHEFSWDGKTADGEQLEAGRYRFVAEARSGDKTVSFDTYAGDRVQSVSLGDGNAMKVNLAGLGDVSLADIKRVAQ